MELEKQVANLELSKKLNELGVKQESYFSWIKDDGEWFVGRKLDIQRRESIPAPTVAELGELLPEYFATHRPIGQPPAWTCDNVLDGLDEYDSIWGDEPEKYPLKNWVDETEANARAKMYIYLLENDLLT